MQDSCPTPEPFRESIGIIVFLAWLFYLAFISRIIFAPIMPALEHSFDISHTQAGSLFLMISLGFLIAPFCSGIISSKINHRWTLFLSAIVIGVALGLFNIFDSFFSIQVLMIVIGFSAGLHTPSAIATITAQVTKEDWGKALGLYQTSPPFTFVTAPIIAAALMGVMHWKIILLLIGCMAVLSGFTFAFFGKGGDFPGQALNVTIARDILQRPSFWIMACLFAMAMAGNAGIFTMLPLYLTNERGMTLTFANTIIGLSQISGLVMVFVAGLITDRIGQQRTMASVLVTGGILTLLLGASSGKLLIVAIFLQPIFINSFFPGAFGALARIAPPSMRSVSSALAPPISFLLGGGIIPIFLGYMGETFSFSTGIITVGIIMLLMPVLILFLKIGQYDNEDGC
ncbi:MAG: MFS transporter [Deltaproteobacteria bacterium]|nr:MFS transporter [Deltaproteobacteria bacterium]